MRTAEEATKAEVLQAGLMAATTVVGAEASKGVRMGASQAREAVTGAAERVAVRQAVPHRTSCHRGSSSGFRSRCNRCHINNYRIANPHPRRRNLHQMKRSRNYHCSRLCHWDTAVATPTVVSAEGTVV